MGPASPRVWFSRIGPDSAPRSYLLALALGEKEVPRWGRSGFYDALVEGVEYKPHHRTVALSFESRCEDDWGAGSDGEALPV
eukprot:4074770-Alexandrium_andersonii.AAC.1